MKYRCPVCLVDCLDEPYKPNSYDICHTCGVEYGNDDYGTSHEELRRIWVEAGRPNWWEETERPDFQGGVRWLDAYFAIKENEERKGAALAAIFKKQRRK